MLEDIKFDNVVVEEFELDEVLEKWGGVEVDAMTVYSDMFNLGYGDIQSEKQETRNMVANPLGYWKNGEFNNREIKGHYRVMFEDTFEERLKELQNADTAILNGITYFGRSNVQEHASKMYAMIFDLDGVTVQTLNTFLHGAFSKNYKMYPLPNYITLSGTGIHLYYLFEYPIPLYPNLKLQLKAFKEALTKRMWNRYTSTIEKIQIQGINQGFRVIGGKTKVDGVRVRAFRMNEHPFNLTQLGEYVGAESRVDESKLFKESTMPLSQAKKKYPKWWAELQEFTKENERRKIKGERLLKKEVKPWECKNDLYEWWKRQIEQNTTYGHRYFAIMCLAIYGVKCGVGKETVKDDALALVPFLNEMNPDFPFTEDDCISALECYDYRYCTFPRDDISRLSGIAIKQNKRNGRKQKVHLERARAVQNLDYPNGTWRVGNGRPAGSSQKKFDVWEWRYHNPNGKKVDCVRDTGISKPTVLKWWASFADVSQSDGIKIMDNEGFEFYKMLEGKGEKVKIHNYDLDIFLKLDFDKTDAEIEADAKQMQLEKINLQGRSKNKNPHSKKWKPK